MAITGRIAKYIGRGLEGLNEYLVDAGYRGGIDELLSSPGDFRPEKGALVQLVNDLRESSQKDKPLSMMQLYNLSALSKGVRRTAEEASELEPVYDAAESFSARAAGTESDPFGIDPETGRQVYTKFTDPAQLGSREVTTPQGETLTLSDLASRDPHGSFSPERLGPSGERLLFDVGPAGGKEDLLQISRTEPTRRGGRLEGGLEAEGAVESREIPFDSPYAKEKEAELLRRYQKGELKKVSYDRLGGLPYHLASLRYNIKDMFTEQIPRDASTNAPIAGEGKVMGPRGIWENKFYTQKEAEATARKNTALERRLDKLKKDDWLFVDQALNEGVGRKWAQAKRFVEESNEPVSEAWNKTGINWRGQESLILRDVLKAVDNAVEAKSRGAVVDDPRDWYYMGQLQEDYQRMWGDLTGTRLFLDFMNMIGASTAGQRPHTNFTGGSYYAWLNYHNQLFSGSPISEKSSLLGKGRGKTVFKGKIFRDDLEGRADIPNDIKDMYMSKRLYSFFRKKFGPSFDNAFNKKEDGLYETRIFMKGLHNKKSKLYNIHGVKWKDSFADELTNKEIKKQFPEFTNTYYNNPNVAPENDSAIMPMISGPSIAAEKIKAPGGPVQASGYAPTLGAGMYSGTTHQPNIISAQQRAPWMDDLLGGALSIQGTQGQQLWEQASRRFRLDPVSATKGAHFAAALAGNLQSVTLDKVMSDLLYPGLGKQAPATGHYTYLQEFIQDIANGYDIDPQALQAVAWIGSEGKEWTAGESGSSAIRTLDERIRITTALWNKLVKNDNEKLTPKQVRDLAIKQVIPLMGLLPAMNLGIRKEDFDRDMDG